jgi:hypothetical protein
VKSLWYINVTVSTHSMIVGAYGSFVTCPNLSMSAWRLVSCINHASSSFFHGSMFHQVIESMLV